MFDGSTGGGGAAGKAVIVCVGCLGRHGLLGGLEAGTVCDAQRSSQVDAQRLKGSSDSMQRCGGGERPCRDSGSLV